MDQVMNKNKDSSSRSDAAGKSKKNKTKRRRKDRDQSSNKSKSKSRAALLAERYGGGATVLKEASDYTYKRDKKKKKKKQQVSGVAFKVQDDEEEWRKQMEQQSSSSDSESEDGRAKRLDSDSSSAGDERGKKRLDSSDDEAEESDDLSPPRRNNKRSRADSSSSSGSDLAVPRRPPTRQKDDDSSSSSSSSSDDDTKPKTKMSSGVSGGLKDGETYRQELDQAKRVAKRGDQDAGQPQQTIYRDKHGRKIDIHAEDAKRKQKDRDEAKVLEALKQEWGKGSADRSQALEKQKEFEDARNRQFAVFEDDESFNKDLKQQLRPGDPMAKFLQGQQSSSETNDLGFPTYKGPPPPPNRFGISPGYRWDGICRDNGFEKKFLAMKAANASFQQEKYQHLSADM